jgi:hypothetical protein
MFDIIYNGAAKPYLRVAFPNAEFADAGDFLHEGGFSIRLPDEAREEYLKVLILKGWAVDSIMVRIGMRTPEGSNGKGVDAGMLARLIGELLPTPPRYATKPKNVVDEQNKGRRVMAKTKIAPCPWHPGETAADDNVRLVSISERHWVTTMCGANGPRAKTRAQAIKEWNRVALAALKAGA